MKIFNEISPIRAFLKDIRSTNKTIGLVPTMGALHKGHLTLLEEAKKHTDITICSIYVNPTQFNNISDLENYPRTLDKDTELLKKVGCNILFSPKNEEMYPSKPKINFNFGHLEQVMEGQHRPGHFSGVALVVSKLFHIVEPDLVFFGQKDWQQFCIIRQLASDLSFPLELVWVPTVRETDGLAQSSRNLRLVGEQRKQAGILYEALNKAKTELQNGVQLQPVKEQISRLFAHQEGVRLEYFELADSKNLNLLNSVEESDQPILCIAGYIGDVRLIDNMFLDL